jgi:adenylate cyclase class IV
MQSKLNLELKYFCKDFTPIRRALRELGAKKAFIKSQKDYFLNLPEDKKMPARARLKLRVEDKKQRLVFYRRPNFSAKGGTHSDVLLLPIKDKNLLDFLSKALGVRAIVEKKRELWKKDNTVFHLDTLKGVGRIFEIEVWPSSTTIKKDRAKFNYYCKKLLPFLDKIVKGSNEDLVSPNKIS